MSEPTTSTILLVEDNPADVYLIQKAVEECGDNIHLSIIPNGRDALAFLRKEGAYAISPSPALILLDLNLPHLHGDKVLTELRHMPAYQATPVVIFSSAKQDIEEQRCLHLGANGYVQKPSDLTQFFAAVQALVRKWLTPGVSSA